MRIWTTERAAGPEGSSMPGLIHLSHTTPAHLSRRALMLGAASVMASASLGATNSAMALARTPATPATDYLPATPSIMVPPDPAAHFRQLNRAAIAPNTAFVVFSWCAPTMAIEDAGIWSLDPLFGRATRSAFGFEPTSASAISMVGDPLDAVTVYSITVDRVALYEQWSSAGYQMSDDDVWVFPAEGDDPVVQASNGLVTCLTFVPGGVMMARSLSRLAQAFDTDGATAETVVTDAGVPKDALSAIMWTGEFVRDTALVPEGDGGTVSSLLNASDDAVGAMPPVQDVLGWATPAVTGIRLRFASAEEANTAHDIIAWRRAHMTSPTLGTVYASAWEPFEASVDRSSVSLIARREDARALWHTALTGRDCWPLAWRT